MPLTTDKKKEWVPVRHLILNLGLTLIWGIIGSLIIIWKISLQSSSALVGLLLGFTTTLLILSPFIYHHNHKKILSNEETDPQKQLLTSIKFVGLLVLITAVLSILFAFLHQQFLVILK
jgi:hypothetical protein